MSGLPGYPGGLPLRPLGMPSLPPGSFPPVPPHLAPRPLPPFLSPSPGPMMMPPRGLIPPPGAVAMPVALGGAPKSTIVYVGKIPNTAEDETIKSLLEVCGEVKSWKRAEDPETHQPKGFGFCEFDHAEGVLRAIRLLNNLTIDGQELLVRSNTATAKYVESYEKERELRVPEEKEEGEDVPSEEQKDNKVLEKIMAFLTDREEKKQKEEAGIKDQVSETSHQSKIDSESRRHVREDGRRRVRDSSSDSRAARELSRERREMETRRRDEESAYRKRLYDWERYELRLEKELQRDMDRSHELRKDRDWNLRADLELDESDDEREPWARKTIRDSRKSRERKKIRDEEEEWEKEDKTKELEEAEQKRQKSESSEPMEIDVEPHEEAPIPTEFQEQIHEADRVAKSVMDPKLNPNPSAMDMDDHETSEEVTVGSSSIALTLSGKRQTKLRSSQPSNEALKDVFGEEDEDQPKREMRILNFSDDDGEKMEITQTTTTSAKALIDALPKSKDEIYSYPIKWESYNGEELGSKIESWVNKKVSEILGFEEESLSSFIMNQLGQHQPPSVLEQELSEVLEDEKETETFIMKLYRTVIFETEKRAAAIGP